MRKILMIVIIILLCILAGTMIFNGFQVFGLEVLGIQQIEEENKNLDTKIEEINTLVDTEYPKKMSELKTAGQNMTNARDEYLKYTNLSTDEEILAAMQGKSYKIEFLWTKLGVHARKQGVKLKFEIVPSSTGSNNVNDIKFTLNGSYIAITNFVYAVENDSELGFKIENFKLLPTSSGDVLEGTFTVRNVAIEGNTSSKTVTNTTTNTNTETNTETSTTSSTTGTTKI